jgi:hypothetical protein
MNNLFIHSYYSSLAHDIFLLLGVNNLDVFNDLCYLFIY